MSGEILDESSGGSNEMDEMRFQNKVSMTKEEFETLAKSIKANL